MINKRILYVVLTVLPVSVCIAETDSGEARRSAGKVDVPVTADTAIRLDLASGEIWIKAAGDDRLTADMTIRCPEDDDECNDQMEESIDFAVSRGDNRIVVTTDRKSVFGDRDTHSLVTFYIPESRSLGVEMPAGKLTIDSVRSCVDAHVTAGRVDITVSPALVSSINLAATFGDVSLVGDGFRRRGERAMLVGARLEWDEGRGACDVDVNVMSGDVVATVEDGAAR